jgi:hypothetical protein
MPGLELGIVPKALDGRDPGCDLVRRRYRGARRCAALRNCEDECCVSECFGERAGVNPPYEVATREQSSFNSVSGAYAARLQSVAPNRGYDDALSVGGALLESLRFRH